MKKVLPAIISVLVMCCFCVSCNLPSGNSNKIEMPKSSSDYISSFTDPDALIAEFKKLGFSKAEKKEGTDPRDDDYRSIIQEISIEEDIFTSSQKWDEGDKFPSDAEITVYYNPKPLLTIDNCTDLKNVLSNSKADFSSFAKDYDGRYVEFDACVVENIEDYRVGNLVYVAGGDYSSEGFKGVKIYVRDNDVTESYNLKFSVGTNVKVVGKITSRNTDYYKFLTIDLKQFEKR